MNVDKPTMDQTQPQLTLQEAYALALDHLNAGRYAEADKLCTAIIQANPKHINAINLLGVIAQRVNRHDLAVEQFNKAIAIDPDQPLLHFNLALSLFSSGRLHEALAPLEKALSKEPGNSRYTNLLHTIKSRLATAESDNVKQAQKALDQGMAHHTQGRLDAAIECYEKCLQIQHDNLAALSNLGLALHEQGKLDAAEAACRHAIGVNGDCAEAHFNLANILTAQERFDAAIASFQKTIEIEPEHVAAHNNLGHAFEKSGDLEAAAASFQGALSLQPDLVEVCINLAHNLHKQDRLDEAVTAYRKALAIKPGDANAYNGLGMTLMKSGKIDAAVKTFKTALAFNPEHPRLNFNTGKALQKQGKHAEALTYIDRAINLTPENDGWRIQKALLSPIIHHSAHSLRQWRTELGTAIDQLLTKNLSISDPPDEIGASNFYLAYHGENNRELLEKIAKLHIAATPGLEYVAPHCKEERPQNKQRLKIGIISAALFRHTVAEHFRGMIKELSRKKFEVTVIHAPGKQDDMSRLIQQSADRVVFLDGVLEKDRKTVGGLELDILFYLDIGMDQYTYFLSFSRLAPVQAVSIGHAETSGVPNIDYFLSSRLSEVDGAEEHYSEQLVQLSLLPVYYYRPQVPKESFKRRDFGLPDDKRLYVYPHSLFKLHPEFDATLGKLLRGDQDGRLVLVDADNNDNLSVLLRERFVRSFPDVAKNVIFIPYMAFKKFIWLLLTADALLDNPYISGTSAGLISLGLGQPIVAWPGRLCSCRCVTACYEQMGLNDLVAGDEEEFLQLALRLARDQEFKKAMQAKIRTNSHKLFERAEVVREIEDFFVQAYEGF